MRFFPPSSLSFSEEQQPESALFFLSLAAAAVGRRFRHLTSILHALSRLLLFLREGRKKPEARERERERASEAGESILSG